MTKTHYKGFLIVSTRDEDGATFQIYRGNEHLGSQSGGNLATAKTMVDEELVHQYPEENMDPNANLAAQQSILTEYAATVGPVPEANERLRRLRAALRVWLDKGGFEPLWVKCPRASKYFGR